MVSCRAILFDGKTAQDHSVIVELKDRSLVVSRADGTQKQEWFLSFLKPVLPFRKESGLRLSNEKSIGARLTLPPGDFVDQLLFAAPHLKGGFSFSRFARAALTAVAIIGGVAAAIYGLFSFAPEKLAFLMPDSWRLTLGQHVEKAFVESAHECASAAGSEALAHLTTRIAEGNSDIPDFSLRVYDIPVVNAFALPGGRIVLFRELINRASAPDEVAGVLSHEIGHVAMRHPEAQFIRSIGIQLALSLATGGGTGSSTFGNLAGLLAILSYSRAAETDADAYGLRILSQAAIDPTGLKRFFETVARDEGKSVPGPLGKIGNILSTHPVTAERIERIEPLSIPPRPVLSDSDWQALKDICN